MKPKRKKTKPIMSTQTRESKERPAKAASLAEFIESQQKAAEQQAATQLASYRALIVKETLEPEEQSQLTKLLSKLGKTIEAIGVDRGFVKQVVDMQADLDKTSNATLQNEYRTKRDEFSIIDNEYRALTEKRRLAELSMLSARSKCDMRDDLQARLVGLKNKHPDLFD